MGCGVVIEMGGDGGEAGDDSPLLGALLALPFSKKPTRVRRGERERERERA